MLNRTLTDLCQVCRNYFPVKVLEGKWVISDGVLDCPEIQDNQYYLITGSLYNDAELHTNTDYLTDEEFEGVITLCAIPVSFTDLAVKIDIWKDKYEGADSVVNSPFSSESFGGYSYNKQVGASSWEDVFSRDIRRWRKI